MLNLLSDFFRGEEFIYCKKSRIRETLNLLTDADHRTNIFFWGGEWSKKEKKKKLHLTRDT